MLIKYVELFRNLTPACIIINHHDENTLIKSQVLDKCCGMTIINLCPVSFDNDMSYVYLACVSVDVFVDVFVDVMLLLSWWSRSRASWWCR